jgi:hypothetical protein
VVCGHNHSGPEPVRKFVCGSQPEAKQDVHLPTTDGREIVLSRYTQPEREMCLLLVHLKLTLPQQAPPKIYSTDKDSNLKTV